MGLSFFLLLVEVDGDDDRKSRGRCFFFVAGRVAVDSLPAALTRLLRGRRKRETFACNGSSVCDSRHAPS
jgi:hypothetical protein